MGPYFEGAVEVAAAVNSGKLTAVDVIEAFLDRIEERNEVTNSVVTVLEDEARERAREVDDAVAEGATLPLAGVPVGMKDLGMTKEGVRHTLGLAPLADNVAAETSTIIRRLEDAGAVVVCTTNTPELGHRVRTDNHLVGPTTTPFDTERNAGGSSGGSAAALADGLCALATGSDLGGSLRTPAACCGVVSVKPTFGVVPRDTRPNAYGGYSPFSVWGPMARDVESLAWMLEVVAGPTPRDPTSVPKPESYVEAVSSQPDASEFAVARSPDLGLFAVDPTVQNAVDASLTDLEAAGVTVENVTVDAPPMDELLEAYSAQALANMATTIDRIREGFDVDLLGDHADEIPDHLADVAAMGRDVELPAYLAADRTRTTLYDAIDAALEGYDALACPTLATPPLTHDEPLPTEIDGEPVNGLNTDWTLAWPFNLTGHPVVNVPAERVSGLPTGVQLVGRPHSEARLLQLAAAFETASPWDYPGA